MLDLPPGAGASLVACLLGFTACVGPTNSAAERPARSTPASSRHPAILGGQVASPSEFPSVLAIQESTFEVAFCSGSLIDPSWVMTAAHCVVDFTADDLEINFDDQDVLDASDGRVVAVSEVHVHPEYRDPVLDHDIALLRLVTPMTDREPTPVARQAVAAGTEVIEVGYGISDSYSDAGVMHSLHNQTVDCAMAHDTTVSGANVLCFDARSGQVACFGDSGGPDLVDVAGVRSVVGFTSTAVGGTGSDLSCDQDWDIHTQIARELPFIDQYVPVVAGGETGGDTGDDGGDGGPRSTAGGCSTTRTAGAGAPWLAGVVFLTLRLTRRARRPGTLPTKEPWKPI